MRGVLISVFNGPEPAVCHRRLACRMGLHSITCHPIQANPSLPYIWEEGQTAAYYCRNLPSSEAGTNLYCLVDRSTCVNNLPKVVTWQCRGAESNLRPEQPQDYKSATLPLDYQATLINNNHVQIKSHKNAKFIDSYAWVETWTVNHYYMAALIGRAHSLTRAMEFWAEPRNLPFSAEFWYCCRILQKLRNDWWLVRSSALS